jgi:hypothetical protein
LAHAGRRAQRAPVLGCTGIDGGRLVSETRPSSVVVEDLRRVRIMTDRTATRAPAPASSTLAASARFRTFAVTFAVVTPVLYLICLFWNLPLFTYHPAVDRIDLGWTPARSGEGPAMYWYGWSLTALVAGAITGFLATMLPERVTRKIPLYLLWLLPILTLPLLAYSLREFWLHP